MPGRTQGSRDCGPRSGQMGIDAITQGQRRPAPQELRERMGTPGPQQTNIWDMKKGVESYKNVPGRKPLRYYIKRKLSELKQAAAAGKPIQLCIHYGVWNQQASKTGDPFFTGGHSVLIRGQRRKGGRVQWLLFDPLDDSRRSSIAQGPRWVDRSKLIAAVLAFAGGNPNGIYVGVFAGGQKK